MERLPCISLGLESLPGNLGLESLPGNLGLESLPGNLGLESLPGNLGLESLPNSSMSEFYAPQNLSLCPAELLNLRIYSDFPVNARILDFITETVLVIDYSFQNIINNIKSVHARCRSESIGRLLNTNIGSNPVTGVENYFNNLRYISLNCDHACASKVTEIYEWVSSKDLFDRPLKAPIPCQIPKIKKLSRDILNYDKNGILVSPDPEVSGCFGKASIPFSEVIEL
jgi:hypothetical protein